MKKAISFILIMILMVTGMTGCKGKEVTDTEKKLKIPATAEFIETTTWNDDMMEAYLKPYWYSREIYNETVVFIGEEGKATLMYQPSLVKEVRNYKLDTTYVEGRDYIIEGNTIKRVKGGNAPYWNIDEFFLVQPNVPGVTIGCNMSKVEYEFEENRYLRYGEGDMFTSKQLAVTYRHDQLFDGEIPKHQPEKLQSFLGKLKNKEKLNIMIYGDSVAVGCNASGTTYGGNISPYMPYFGEILKQYLEKNFEATIDLKNEAVGGWQLSDCLNGYNSKIKEKDIDLMILRIGGNDGHSNQDKYIFEMVTLLDKFFTDHPDANVILQTPELPNQQSTWTLNVGKIEDWTKEAISESSYKERIALAPVQSFSKWIEGRGKLNRDFLANNINHGNDFIIRYYVQTLLKVMLGNEYVEEIYE